MGPVAGGAGYRWLSAASLAGPTWFVMSLFGGRPFVAPAQAGPYLVFIVWLVACWLAGDCRVSAGDHLSVATKKVDENAPCRSAGSLIWPRHPGPAGRVELALSGSEHRRDNSAGRRLRLAPQSREGCRFGPPLPADGWSCLTVGMAVGNDSSAPWRRPGPVTAFAVWFLGRFQLVQIGRVSPRWLNLPPPSCGDKKDGDKETLCCSKPFAPVPSCHPYSAGRNIPIRVCTTYIPCRFAPGAEGEGRSGLGFRHVYGWSPQSWACRGR